jgi:predicted component of type VI protein secretion system
MQAKGNGNKETCTKNLMSIFTGAVPYARAKGINAANIDRPVTTVIARLATETRKMIEKYEPRAEVTNASVKSQLVERGYLTNNVEIKTREE